jgi:ABC-type oligopeptide transport system substrate-binding subunit
MGSPRSLLSSAGAVLLGAVALAGCGGSDPKSAVTTYLNALASGDGKTACAQLDPAAINKLIGSAAAGQSCAGLLSSVNKLLPASQKQALQNAKITGSSTSGNNATVNLTINGRSREVKLVNSSGKWVITGGSAVGG